MVQNSRIQPDGRVVNSGLGVRIIYRDNQLNPRYEKTYTLEGYLEMLRKDLMRIIGEVEDLCYEANGHADKSEWTDETWDMFSSIKHKLLDKAGDIGRLAENLFNMTEEVAEDGKDRLG